MTNIAIVFCIFFIFTYFKVNAAPSTNEIDYQMTLCKVELRCQLDKIDPKIEIEQWQKSFEFLDNDDVEFRNEIAAAEKEGKDISACLNFREKELVQPRKEFSKGNRKCMNIEWERLLNLINNHQLVTINDDMEVEIVSFQDGDECVKKLRVPSTPSTQLEGCFKEEIEKLRKFSKDISINKCIQNHLNE